MNATDDRITLSPRGHAVLRDATAYLTALAFDHPLPQPQPDDPDWLAAFREASGIQGLGPYLGLRVADGAIAPPAPVSAWLVGQMERNRLRLARLDADLLTTLDALDRARLTAIPIKGAALLLHGVDHVVWRAMGDLDLLVPASNERALDLALAHSGYCLSARSWKHRRYAPCGPRPPLIHNDGEHPGNPRDLEVHAAVVEMFRGIRWDLTPWITRSLTLRSDRLAPDDRAMALHLAVHASLALLEGTARAIQLVDLARALDRAGPESLLLAVRNAGLRHHSRFVYPAVALAARETSSPSCAAVTQALAHHIPPPMREWAGSVSLFAVSWAGRHDRAALDRHALWALDTSDRLRMLRHTLLPGPAVLADDDQDPDAALHWPRTYARHYLGLGRRVVSQRPN